jgi:hydrogenase-4 component F
MGIESIIHFIQNDAILLMLLTPLFAAILCALIGTRREMGAISVTGSILTLLFGLLLIDKILVDGSASALNNFLYADGLSAYLVLIISVIGLLANIYSVSYIHEEYAQGQIDHGRLRLYHFLLNLFLFTMLSAVVANNLGVLWVMIEGTTLASAFLVGLYDREESVEAAWKYLILGSVGITFALFGTILVYFSAQSAFQNGTGSLNWTDLSNPAIAHLLDPSILKLAFIFLLVGYGTKAGLAPMHTWLPDAHSHAPTPISALLSGVLINAAMYGILRYHHLLLASPVTPGFSANLLLIFGLLSIGIATPFILVQKDYKRLFAYSSIKHMGLIAVGIGLGTPLSQFGALLHILNHALSKALAFMGAGNVLLKYHTREIARVVGAAKIMPIAAAFFFLGTLAISGVPPFGTFLSEFLILAAGFSAGRSWVSGLVLLFLAIAFAGFIIHASRMVFGNAPKGVVPEEAPAMRLWPMAMLVFLVLLLGLYIPSPLHTLLQQAITAVNYP